MATPKKKGKMECKNSKIKLFKAIGSYWIQMDLKSIFLKLKFSTFNNGIYINFRLVDELVYKYVYGLIYELEIWTWTCETSI